MCCPSPEASPQPKAAAMSPRRSLKRPVVPPKPHTPRRRKCPLQPRRLRPEKRAAAKKAPARKKKAAAKRAPARRKSTARKTTARKSTARKSTAKKATKQEGDQEEGDRSQEGRDEADTGSQEHEEGDAQEGSDTQARREEDSPQALTSLGAPVIVRVRPAHRRSGPGDGTPHVRTTRAAARPAPRTSCRTTTRASPRSRVRVPRPSTRVTASLLFAGFERGTDLSAARRLRRPASFSTSGSPMSTPVTKCASNSASSSAGNAAGHARGPSPPSRARGGCSARVSGPERHADGLALAADRRVHRGEAAVRASHGGLGRQLRMQLERQLRHHDVERFAAPRSGPVRGSTTGRCSRTRP